MASRMGSQLVKASLYLGGGYVLYKMADNGTIGGNGGFPQKVANEMKALFHGATGGAGAAVTPPSGGTLGAASTTSYNVGSGPNAILPFRDIVTLSQDAKSKGITDQTNPSSIVYGRTWWAINHSGDATGFNAQTQATQIQWQSYAIHGY
ncbi:MAG TPA: hypothetical protein VIU62_15125 [Chloroflexota bacterium]